jgi:Transglycosylase SLT domain
MVSMAALPMAAVLTSASSHAPQVTPETILAFAQGESVLDLLAIHGAIASRVYSPRSLDGAIQLAYGLMRDGDDLDPGLLAINQQDFSHLGLIASPAFDPVVSIRIGACIMVEDDADIPFYALFLIFFRPGILVVLTFKGFLTALMPGLWPLVKWVYVGNPNRPFEWLLWIVSGVALADWWDWGEISNDPHGKPTSTQSLNAVKTSNGYPAPYPLPGGRSKQLRILTHGSPDCDPTARCALPPLPESRTP